ncbi:hypothetical protein FTUN_5959 [Frigoriglobus tundricola]|uniref:Uncharacterized protein n=1 Tax=Frigoriglobus tundricola TaxID=2774151 RepID=A0A6M5YWP0_9BACT|nr:hypothetical protein FTUN_5959 [Frigoriglobus tundricola]
MTWIGSSGCVTDCEIYARWPRNLTAPERKIRRPSYRPRPDAPGDLRPRRLEGERAGADGCGAGHRIGGPVRAGSWTESFCTETERPG